jgi:hypothetical protein
VKTNYGGFPPKKGRLLLAPTMSLFVMVAFLFSWKSIWRTKVPFRAAIFVWSVTLGKILTMNNLKKRYVVVVDKCCMCKRDGESVDYLLLHCEVALWSVFYSRFGLSWVMPRRVAGLYACWWTSGSNQSAVV